jgi:heme-degrading monooxygenase HmoA
LIQRRRRGTGLVYVIVWEFRINSQMEAEFVRHYGPEGSWAQFFSRSKGYIRTDLMRDVADRLRFVTLDYWQSQEEFDGFREQNLVEYERLDEQFEGLTKKETRLGAFETS